MTTFINWEMDKFCNFKCEYCFNRSEKKQFTYGKNDVKKMVDGFNKIDGDLLIQISGGEPFLWSRFTELCGGLTEKHRISINTNLSTGNIYDFAEQIDPKRIEYVHCSLHIEERKRKGLVEDFISKYHHLKDNGFNIYASQVLYPPILKRFDEYFALLKDNGIILKPKTFRGNYMYMHYPYSYSRQDRDRILGYVENYKELSDFDNEYGKLELSLEKELINGDLSFRGMLCNAGMNSVTVDREGNVTRCHGERTWMGNIFDGSVKFLTKPTLCSAKICPCPFFGFLGVEGERKPNVVKIDMLTEKIDSVIRKITRM